MGIVRSHRTAVGLALAAFAASSAWSGAVGTAQAEVANGVFSSVTPCTLLDTTSPTSPVDGLLAGEPVEVSAAGTCGVPGDATAVVVTLRVIDTVAAPGFLTVWPSGMAVPEASMLSWSTIGSTRTTSTIVALAADGKLSLQSNVDADVSVDVSGAFTPAATATAGRFASVTPARLLDSRTNGGPFAAGETRRVPLPAGVPTDAVALSLNVTTTKSLGAGFVTVAAAGGTPTSSSVLDTDGAGQTRAAAVFAPASSAGIDVTSTAGGQVLVDIVGYFTGPSAPASADGMFVATLPTRVLDTRRAGSSVFYPGGAQVVDTTAVTGSVAAVVMSLTITRNAALGFVTAFPAGGALPNVSSVNADEPLQNVSNTAVTASGAHGVNLAASMSTHLVADVLGWFTGSPMPDAPVPYVVRNEPPPPPPNCSYYATGRAAIIDKAAQRFWLCRDGVAVTGFRPLTSGPVNNAPVGTYHVFFKRDPWWGGGYQLRRFVAFAYGPNGGRIAFHQYVAMPESGVGSAQYRDKSHGCMRIRTDDSYVVWNFLQYGDPVKVITNG